MQRHCEGKGTYSPLPNSRLYFLFKKTPTWCLFQLSRVLGWGLEVETDIKCFQNCLVSKASKDGTDDTHMPLILDLWAFQASLMCIPGLHRESQASQSKRWDTTSETAQVVKRSCETLSLIPGFHHAENQAVLGFMCMPHLHTQNNKIFCF